MIRWALLLIACVTLSPATELYSWHSFDAVVLENQRVELLMHSRLRTRDAFGDFNQVRFGSIGRIRLRQRLIFYAGYYFQPGDSGDDKIWGKGHRLFSGIEVPMERGRLALTLRAAAERNFQSLDQDYNRYRTYTRLKFRRRVSPFLQNELLADNSGFHSLRNGAGVQFRIGPQTTVEVSYMYDSRAPAWGGDRQAIVTSVRFHLFRSASHTEK